MTRGHTLTGEKMCGMAMQPMTKKTTKPIMLTYQRKAPCTNTRVRRDRSSGVSCAAQNAARQLWHEGLKQVSGKGCYPREDDGTSGTPMPYPKAGLHSRDMKTPSATRTVILLLVIACIKLIMAAIVARASCCSPH